MSNIYFTSDTHFNHPQTIGYCGRPFSCPEEMDTALIKNWNDIVKPRDIVYHLGDFAFGKNEIVKKYRYRLHGKIHLILGNHDYRNKIQRLTPYFSSVHDLLEYHYDKKTFILCHYAMRVWSKSHYGSFHLYGHSHGNLLATGRSMDVGVDTNNYKPYSIDEIIKILGSVTPNYPESHRKVLLDE